ncbi:hypothetical protein MN116_007705 [Schistosoma mekongi]|uniref:Uncharacterized protein n=1 Tax=Schistosoma mekongi TaxID=38744 RepID=A0AAE2D299_SCHME|nr:hypothetical protein MN116_007705 [Schistosoma mekongi]
MATETDQLQFISKLTLLSCTFNIVASWSEWDNFGLRLRDTFKCFLDILPANLGGKNKTCISSNS